MDAQLGGRGAAQGPRALRRVRAEAHRILGTFGIVYQLERRHLERLRLRLAIFLLRLASSGAPLRLVAKLSRVEVG